MPSLAFASRRRDLRRKGQSTFWHLPWASSFCLLTLLATQPSQAQAQGSLDRVNRHNGSDRGKVTQISPLEVTVSKGGVDKRIPTEEIRSIQYAGEPTELKQVRLAIERGQFEDARQLLTRMDSTGVTRDAILQDIEYYDTVCKAKDAIASPNKLEQAIRQVNAYYTRHRNSYHVPALFELWGNLLLLSEKHDEARLQYEKLAKARSPVYKMRSQVLVGQSYLAQQNYESAQVAFKKVVTQDSEASQSNNALAKEQHLAAQLGLAICQASMGNAELAIESVKQVIAQSDPEDARLQGRSFNTLGTCYLRGGNKKGALDAYLHVDLIYSQIPKYHAQALHELSQLWPQLGYESRGREARAKLLKQYPKSQWANQ